MFLRLAGKTQAPIASVQLTHVRQRRTMALRTSRRAAPELPMAARRDAGAPRACPQWVLSAAVRRLSQVFAAPGSSPGTAVPLVGSGSEPASRRRNSRLHCVGWCRTACNAGPRYCERAFAIRPKVSAGGLGDAHVPRADPQYRLPGQESGACPSEPRSGAVPPNAAGACPWMASGSRLLRDALRACVHRPWRVMRNTSHAQRQTRRRT